jgi:predicted transcriptional regulator
MSDVSSNIITPPLVSRIVSSYVKKNRVAPSDMPAVISTVYASLIKLGKDLGPKTTQLAAVSIRQSVRSSYVVCLECECTREDAAETPGAGAWAQPSPISG